jgi:activator of 2-hydroxyglutaryl-CoA dehydratase
MLKAGIDVGSTTVKGILLDEKGKIVFAHYERHEARQAEKVLKLLEKFERLPLTLQSLRLLYCRDPVI